jgi:hypothetical protein
MVRARGLETSYLPDGSTISYTEVKGVRKAKLVFRFYGFQSVLCVFSILASLLSLKQATPLGSSDGVLIRF